MRTVLRNAAVGGSRRVSGVYHRLANLLQFQLEQFLLRGALSRLLVIAIAIGLLSVAAGLAVFYERQHHAGRLRIVILAERVGPALVQELKDRLGRRWKPRQVILRSGSALGRVVRCRSIGGGAARLPRARRAHRQRPDDQPPDRSEYAPPGSNAGLYAIAERRRQPSFYPRFPGVGRPATRGAGARF